MKVVVFVLLLMLALACAKPVKEKSELPHSREFYAGYIKAITDNFDQLFESDRQVRSTKDEEPKDDKVGTGGTSESAIQVKSSASVSNIDNEEKKVPGNKTSAASRKKRSYEDYGILFSNPNKRLYKRDIMGDVMARDVMVPLSTAAIQKGGVYLENGVPLPIQATNLFKDGCSVHDALSGSTKSTVSVLRNDQCKCECRSEITDEKLNSTSVVETEKPALIPSNNVNTTALARNASASPDGSNNNNCCNNNGGGSNGNSNNCCCCCCCQPCCCHCCHCCHHCCCEPCCHHHCCCCEPCCCHHECCCEPCCCHHHCHECSCCHHHVHHHDCCHHHHTTHCCPTCHHESCEHCHCHKYPCCCHETHCHHCDCCHCGDGCHHGDGCCHYGCNHHDCCHHCGDCHHGCYHCDCCCHGHHGDCCHHCYRKKNIIRVPLAPSTRQKVTTELSEAK